MTKPTPLLDPVEEPPKVIMLSGRCGQHWVDDCSTCQNARDCTDREILALHDRVDELEGALQRIAEAPSAMDGGSIAECRKIARAALQKGEGGTAGRA